MSQRQQLERILKIDSQIRSGAFPTAQSLARELEVSIRTIYDDRRFMLERLGAPLEFDAEAGGWSYSDPTYVLPTVMMTEGELLAFFLGVDVAQRYLGTAFEAPLRSAMHKLAAGLGGRVPVSLDELQAHYSFGSPVAPQVEPDLLLQLREAIGRRQMVRMRYFTASRGEWTERTVHPYHLHNSGGDWYLFAHDETREEIRSFHAGRIAWCRTSPMRFERDPAFTPAAYLASAFLSERGQPQEIVVRFDAQQAPYIRERRWHATQLVEDLQDGGLLLRFQAGGLEEIKRWVMQYGRHAEVLAPEALRQLVMDEIAHAGRGYGMSV